jgi:hypothetical protein
MTDVISNQTALLIRVAGSSFRDLALLDPRQQHISMMQAVRHMVRNAEGDECMLPYTKTFEENNQETGFQA